MSREQQLLDFAQRLRSVSRAGEWALLAVTDRELGVAWRRLALQGGWTPAEQTALSTLRQAHRDAVARCAAASDEVREQMKALVSRRDGWMAYATDGHESSPQDSALAAGAVSTSKVNA
jgi:hypothetical protein